MRWCVLLAGMCVSSLLGMASAAEGDVSAERGAKISITHGCHDCHTAG